MQAYVKKKLEKNEVILGCDRFPYEEPAEKHAKS